MKNGAIVLFCNLRFIFYDLLPTAADLAGLDKVKWPDVDGLSAVPIFKATRTNQTTQLARAGKNTDF